MREPVRERASEPVREPGKEPVSEPVGESVSEPVGEPVGQPVGEPVAEPARSFFRGVAETLAIVAAFVALGLGWAGLEAAARGAAPAYPGPAMGADEREDAASVPDGGTPPRIWLVDGYNLLNVAMLGGPERDRRGPRGRFWTREMQERVIERAGRLRVDARHASNDAPAECWVVFDAAGRDPERWPDPAPSASSRVRVAFAPSADDWLVRRVKAAADPGLVTVVTADRRVADRARHHGAAVMAPHDFLELCQSGEQPLPP